MTEINAQIPLSARFTPIDPVAASTNYYNMQSAGQGAEQQGMRTEQMGMQLDTARQEKADQTVIQDYLKGGGDLFSEEGLKKATESLRGRVSPSTYQKLGEQALGFKERQAKTLEQLRKTESATFDGMFKASEAVTSTLNSSLQAYDRAWRDVLKTNNPEIDPATADPANPLVVAAKASPQATQAFQAAKQAQLEMIKGAFGGNIPQQYQGLVQRIEKLGPDDARAEFSSTAAARKLLEEAAKQRRSDADADLARARAKTEEVKASVLEQGGPKAVEAANMQEILDDPNASPETKEFARRRMRALNWTAGDTAASKQSVNVNYNKPFEELTPSDQTAVEAAAFDYLINNKAPPARGGLYAPTMAYIGKIAADAGMTVPQLMSAKADIKTAMTARVTVERRLQNMERAENQLLREIPVMEAAMQKLDNPSIPIAARGKLAILRQMGNPDVTQLDQAAGVVLNEFEGIAVGNPGGAMTVDAVRKAREDYHKIQTPQQMRAWIEGAQRIIKNAKDAAVQTREELNKQVMSSIGQLPRGQSGPTSTGAAANIPGNNYGNIRPVGGGPQSGFQQFSTPEEGIQAIDKNLQAYGKQGINTLSKIISTWAPPSDNNPTPALIANASKRLGIPPDQPLDLNNPAVRHMVTGAIMLQEHGNKLYQGGAQPAASKAPQPLAPTAPPTAQAGQPTAAPAKAAEGPKLQEGQTGKYTVNGTTYKTVVKNGKWTYAD